MRSLAAQRLLPGEGHHIELGPIEILGKGGAGGVADGYAGAISRDEVAVGDTDPGGGAVPGEDQIGVRVDLGQVRKLAIGRFQHLGGQLQLFHHIGDPVLAETFKG